MIQKISFQNYKAFEKGEIKFKPITLLLGANSVGKSSIIQLLSMLQQTAQSNKYKSCLKLHGEYVSLGENENIFRNRNTKTDLIIGFEFSDDVLKDLLKDKLLKELIYKLYQPIRFFELRLDNYYKKKTSNNSNYDKKSIEIKSVEINNGIFESKKSFLDLMNQVESINNYFYKERKASDKAFFTSIKKTSPFPYKDTKKSLEKIYDFLTVTRNKITSNNFEIEFKIKHIKSNGEGVLKLSNVSLKQNDEVILNFEFSINGTQTEYDNINISSGYLADQFIDNETKKEILEGIEYNSTLFSWIPQLNNKDLSFNICDSENFLIAQIVTEIISQAITHIKSEFSREFVNHVSPLRAHPKRYYFLDKANINTVLDSLDGNSLTEILKENKIIKDKVNNWLTDFGLRVDVNTLQDVIHKLKVKQNGLELDIIDVGFGISQILPIIVQGFLSFSQSLTMIEQPEIHLHPKMQADLADLFIDIVKPVDKTIKSLLIETHSEYLLKRLRRRISSGVISNEHIHIYYIEPQENGKGAVLRNIEISEKGAFDWPKDFYTGDLADDINIYIENQL